MLAVSAAAALLSASVVTAAVDLQIVHWNDAHARNTPASEGGQQLCLENTYSDKECYGGHPRLATVCKEAKAMNPNTICVDAGDEFLGTVWDVIFKGQQNAKTLPLIGTDVMTVGNHEFDYGVANLAEFVDGLSFPVIGGCNMDLSAEPALNVKKWTVVTLDSDVKVGLIGYIAGDTGELTSAGNIKFMDPVSTVPGCVMDFKAEHPAVNIIGLVSHSGISEDIKVAEATSDDVDFIISAHSHTKMFPGGKGYCLVYNQTSSECLEQEHSDFSYPYMINGVPILQQYYATKYAGVATLTFDSSGKLESSTGESIPLGTFYEGTSRRRSLLQSEVTIADDQAVVDALASGLAEVTAYSEKVIGTLPMALSAARPDIRIQEMIIGNLVCDATLYALAETGFEADESTPLVCIANGGGIRADLPEGQVTYGEVNTVLPFGNVIEVLELSGADLKLAIELSLSEVENVADPPGRFAHLGGGLTVVYDITKSAGERIVGLYADCVLVSDSSMYQVATNNFLAGGGDGYEMFATAERVLTFGPALADAAAEFIVALETTPSLFSFEIQGRIVEVNTGVIPECSRDGGDGGQGVGGGDGSQGVGGGDGGDVDAGMGEYGFGMYAEVMVL